MKKRVFLILSMVHLILWITFLLISVLARFTYHAQNLDPLDFALSKGVYNVFILAALAGIVNAVVLHFSLHGILLHSKAVNQKTRITAFCVAVLATILFYSSVVMIFLINTDIIVIMPIVWVFCLLCCSVLLMLAAKKSIN